MDMEAQLVAAGLGRLPAWMKPGVARVAPISIAACILPEGDIPELARLTDSKKLTEKRREELLASSKK